LTIKNIEALLFKAYNIYIGGSKKKADYVNILEKDVDTCIGKYKDFLCLLAAGVESPGIEDDASAGEQEHVDGGVRVVGNVDAGVDNHDEEEESIRINIVDANVDSNN
jgi:hypothetical protein